MHMGSWFKQEELQGGQNIVLRPAQKFKLMIQFAPHTTAVLFYPGHTVYDIRHEH
jgi:hypothetical protein